MTERGRIAGELQGQIMAVLWRLGDGTVDQVRAALPSPHRSAYTTVQTVLNRLAERGLLVRRKDGHAFVYTPRISEAEYLSQSLQRALAAASSEARRVALAHLVGGLDGEQIADLRRLARQASRERRSGEPR